MENREIPIKTEEFKVLETFSGIGSQHRALKNAKINYKIIGTSE
jgi:site-specific DNA-cytosine methylase